MLADMDEASLVNSAVNFLRDPQVRQTAIEKQNAFLEGKGLSASQIEEARRQADSLAPVTIQTGLVPSSPPPAIRKTAQNNISTALLYMALAVSAGFAVSQSSLGVNFDCSS